MPIRMQARADFQPLLSAGRLPQFSPVRILIFLLSSEVRGFTWSISVISVRTPRRTVADAPAWLFVGPGRNARGFSNLFVVSLYFGCSAKPLRDFPGGLEFVEFRRTDPDLCVRLGIVDDDLLLQSIMVQSTVTLSKVHLFAARIPREIGPHFVVETNRFDNERVSLPPANRVPQPTGVWIFGKWPPFGPDGAPNVELRSARNATLRYLPRLQRPWVPSRAWQHRTSPAPKMSKKDELDRQRHSCARILVQCRPHIASKFQTDHGKVAWPQQVPQLAVWLFSIANPSGQAHSARESVLLRERRVNS